jgi:hypothetical protein
MTEANPTGTALSEYSNSLQAPASMAAAQEKVRQAAERRAAEEDRLDALYEQLDHITGWNLATWLPRITGRIRNRQSQVADAILKQHASRDRAVAEHEAALSGMRETQAAIDRLPLAREAAVAAMTGSGAAEAKQKVAASRQLSEALAAAGRAQALTVSMKGELTSAELWSGHDTLLGGGIVSSAMKQDRIYGANDMGAELTIELTTLRKDLQDLNIPTSYFSVQMNDGIASSDVYFDNLISDISMWRRINNAQDRLEHLEVGLVEISSKLGRQYKSVLEDVDRLLAAELSAPRPAPPG